MSVPAALPTVFLWAGIIFGALAVALATWIIYGVIADRRAGREIDTDTRRHAREEAERIAARDTEAFTTRCVDYPTAVLAAPDARQPTAQREGRAFHGLNNAPQLDDTMPHPTYEPIHHGTWPGEALDPIPQPRQTERTRAALAALVDAATDPEVSDRASVLRATAALAGITVTVKPLLAVERWGVTGLEGGDYCRRDRAQKAITT